MPSFVRSLISSTMETSNHIQGMRENLQKMQDIEQQRQNEEDDRQRNLAMISYKAHADVLSNAELYKNLNDDEIAQHQGSVTASRTTLKRLGVDLPGFGDPTAGAIAQEVWELQTDPKWRMQSEEDRYDHMVNKWGKYFYKVEANYINQKRLSEMSAPIQQVSNQADIDSAAKTNTELISNTLSKGEGPTKIDLVNVPAEIKTSIPGMDAKLAKAKAMFGDYSDVGQLNPKQAAEMLVPAIAKYTMAIQNPNTPPAILASMEKNILAWSKASGSGVTLEYLQGTKYSEPQMTLGQKAQDKRAVRTELERDWTRKWNQLKEETKGAANFMDAQARTKKLRQELWNLEIEMRDHPEGMPMPNGFASFDPVTAAQRESAKAQAQQLAFQQGKSTEQFEYDWARLSQNQTQFETRENRLNQPDASKPDKFGRDPMAVAAALTPAEKAQYSPFFSVETILHAPDRVRKHWQKGIDSGDIEKDIVTEKLVVSPKYKTIFAGIDKEEKRLHPAGGGKPAPASSGKSAKSKINAAIARNPKLQQAVNAARRKGYTVEQIAAFDEFKGN